MGEHHVVHGVECIVVANSKRGVLKFAKRPVDLELTTTMILIDNDTETAYVPAKIACLQENIVLFNSPEP